jgi:hypothetical protein
MARTRTTIKSCSALPKLAKLEDCSGAHLAVRIGPNEWRFRVKPGDFIAAARMTAFSAIAERLKRRGPVTVKVWAPAAEPSNGRGETITSFIRFGETADDIRSGPDMRTRERAGHARQDRPKAAPKGSP